MLSGIPVGVRRLFDIGNLPDRQTNPHLQQLFGHGSHIRKATLVKGKIVVIGLAVGPVYVHNIAGQLPLTQLSGNSLYLLLVHVAVPAHPHAEGPLGRQGTVAGEVRIS